MSDIYRPPGWQELAAAFADMDRAQFPTVEQWLAERAVRVLEAWKAGNAAVAGILNNWHPEWVGEGQEVLSHEPSESDARLAVAREHGFDTWEAVELAGSGPFDPAFEETVDLLLAGDLDGMRARLDDTPNVVRQRSPFGHGATLLHYVAANGVETERQVTPLNAPALVEELLRAGADPEAVMPVYGGQHTTLELLVTSAHPAAAGVTSAVAELLSA